MSSIGVQDKTVLHPNQKPVASMAAILHAYCPPSGLVLDPFMGSGSTLRAAKNLDLRAIGIEIEEGYCKKSAARMAQGILTSLAQIETLRELPDLVQSIEGD
jgi:DNA modification methylase